jgi:hypothetical protein
VLFRSGDQIQLRYLRDARERTPATTLVFLQDTESPYGFGTLIEFAGSITGTNSQKELAKATTSITLTTVQSRRASGTTGDLESQINFPNIRYSNWIPGTREVIHHTVGAPNDPDERDNLLTQAQSLLDDVIAQRTDSTGAIRRLPNIHVYEMPILSTDLSLAHQLFPNVTQFYIFTPEGELELVKIASSRR